jgi:Helitron helicase-like domain at N-terminus
MFTRDLECHLNYIRQNQIRICQDEAAMSDNDTNKANVYLPSSFLGSCKWTSEQIIDTLAIAATMGPPTFFITMTCNPHWPEIESQLRPGQDFHDIPVVVCRVFKQTLTHLLKTLSTMFPNAGHRCYLIYCIEFQKCGLPHAHILIKFAESCVTATDIDKIVSAEIPDDPQDAALVQKHMLHSHPLPHHPPSPYCQREHQGVHHCRFHYPQPCQESTTIDVSGRVHYHRHHREDEMVVPHCLPLLCKYRCHINFEVANTGHLFQYIFKYIHKGIIHAYFSSHLILKGFPGPDRAWIKLESADDTVDEITNFWQARYLSAGEAAWRILGFRLTTKDPAVTALPVHGPFSAQHNQYTRRYCPSSAMSKLLHYFYRPSGQFFDDNDEIINFDDIVYADYYCHFRLSKFDIN